MNIPRSKSNIGREIIESLNIPLVSRCVRFSVFKSIKIYPSFSEGGRGGWGEMGLFLPQSVSSVTMPRGLTDLASRSVRHVRYIYLHFN